MRSRLVCIGALGDTDGSGSSEIQFDPLPRRRPKIIFEAPGEDSDSRKGILLRLRVDTSPAAKDTADKAIETARYAAESFRWVPILTAGAAGLLLGIILAMAWNRAVAASASKRRAA